MDQFLKKTNFRFDIQPTDETDKSTVSNEEIIDVLGQLMRIMF